MVYVDEGLVRMGWICGFFRMLLVEICLVLMKHMGFDRHVGLVWQQEERISLVDVIATFFHFFVLLYRAVDVVVEGIGILFGCRRSVMGIAFRGRFRRGRKV